MGSSMERLSSPERVDRDAGFEAWLTGTDGAARAGMAEQSPDRQGQQVAGHRCGQVPRPHLSMQA